MMKDNDFSIIEIFGETIYSSEDFHKQIEKVLDIYPYYGRNLYSLEDALCSFWNTTLIWHNSDLSKYRLGDYFQNITAIFDRIKKAHMDNKLPSTFTYILE